MRILSVVAVGRLAERFVRKADDQPMPVADLVALLTNYDVADDRARAGVQLSVIVGRLEGTTDSEGRACVQLPEAREAA